jgi:hypothetical protein
VITEKEQLDINAWFEKGNFYKFDYIPLKKIQWMDIDTDGFEDLNNITINDLDFVFASRYNRKVLAGRIGNIWVLAKFIMMCDYHHSNTNTDIEFLTPPQILVKGPGWADQKDIVIEPGYDRLRWAAIWGFDRAKVLLVNPNDGQQGNCINTVDSLQKYYDLSSSYLVWTDGRPIILDRKAHAMIGSAVERLKKSWIHENYTRFKLTSEFVLNNEHRVFIRGLANTDYAKIEGNGWTITNLGTSSYKTIYYNYPRAKYPLLGGSKYQ